MPAFALALMTAVLNSWTPGEVRLPDSLDLETIRALPVQHDGRCPPLDTAARDLVEQVTGDPFYEGKDPLLWLLAWTFDPATWKHVPLITIDAPEVREKLGLSDTATVFSYADLIVVEQLAARVHELAQGSGSQKSDPLQSEARKLFLLDRVFAGQKIRPIPDPDDALGPWRAIEMPAEGQEAKEDPVQTCWADLKDAFLADDAKAFESASKALAEALESVPAAYRPGPERMATELRYNRLRPFRVAWIAMAVATGLAAAALAVRRKWFDALTVAALVLGFGTLSYGLWLRSEIAGRLPAATMFESLLLVGWGIGALAIMVMLVTRDRVVPLTAAAMSALVLVLADWWLPRSMADPYVRPVKPVLLDTIWMTVHVPVTMLSYSVLTLAVLIAHAQLVIMAAAPGRRELAAAAHTMHCWYVRVGSLLLVTGIVTGSMWGAYAWARYWGWDPKEVWSLVAFLAYVAILHVRIDHAKVPPWAYVVAALLAAAVCAMVAVKLAPFVSAAGLAAALTGVIAAMLIFVLGRGHFATALKSIIAFWTIVMTYFGVNFVLGSGLHSYGFGSGAVARYLCWIGGIDLGLVAVCSVTYLIRSRSADTSSALSPS